ncbi:MAG: portal protein [Alphaproteobacteria bacterium]|nr:portal protein [Alphaproteobacteria bacterium]
MEYSLELGHELAFDFTPILIFLLAAVVVVPLFQRIKASPVLAYLVAGAVIGPYAFGLIKDLETTRHIAEFGIIFLLFAIGLELSFDRLKAMRREVFGLGTCQMVITALILGTGAYALGMPIELAIIVGGGLAFSSTALVVQLLSETGMTNTRFGRTAFSILLLQDLAVVPLLALVPLLAEEEQNIATSLGIAGLKAVVALVGLTLLGRLILRPVYRVVAGTRNPELFVGATLLIVLGTSWATAQTGLSLALGAFLAGLLLSETEYVHQIEVDIQPFRGLFVGLFFMSVGMAIDPALVLAEAYTVVGLVVLLLAVKGLLILILCRLFGFPLDISVRVGALLAQCGEFAFVLFGLAVVVGIMPLTTGQLLLVVVGLTMVATPALAALGMRLGAALEHRELTDRSRLGQDTAGLGEHMLIAGFGRVGQTVARLLQDHGVAYIALDLNQKTITKARDQGFQVYYGNAGRFDILRVAGVERARGAVVTLDNPIAAMSAVRALHQLCPHGDIIVRAHDRSNSDELKAAGATMVVPEILEASLQLAGQTLRAAGVPAEVVDASLEALRTGDYAPVEEVIEETKADTPSDSA